MIVIFAFCLLIRESFQFILFRLSQYCPNVIWFAFKKVWSCRYLESGHTIVRLYWIITNLPHALVYSVHWHTDPMFDGWIRMYGRKRKTCNAKRYVIGHSFPLIYLHNQEFSPDELSSVFELYISNCPERRSAIVIIPLRLVLETCITWRLDVAEVQAVDDDRTWW